MRKHDVPGVDTYPCKLACLLLGNHDLLTTAIKEMLGTFSKSVRVNGETLNFAYYAMHGGDEKYFVTTRKGQEYVAFYVEKRKSGTWGVPAGVPRWVKELERQLCSFGDRVTTPASKFATTMNPSHRLYK